MGSHLAGDFIGFKAYLTQRGERNVGMDLVRAMFEDKGKCIAEGHVLAAAMTARTNSLADNFRLVAETGKWRILLVTQESQCRPLDLMHYQKRIDEHIDGRCTLVLTLDVEPLSSGLFNVGLRGAGDNLNISEVA